MLDCPDDDDDDEEPSEVFAFDAEGRPVDIEGLQFEVPDDDDVQVHILHHHHHRPEGSWVDRVLGRRDDLEGF